MTIRTRILLAAASLLLVALYLAPLWRITLEAPQYPEGLGLQIHLSDIDGLKPHDLQNINNLNHYIGMQRIEPDSIPELRIMPWAIALLIVLGLAAAASGKRWMLLAWTGAFLVLVLVGLADFYLWAYDYGHNLDFDNAAIKVPGMVYQPPIIGSKKLLNFTAHSWPALGGWAAFVSLSAGLALSVVALRSGRGSRRTAERVVRHSALVAAASVSFVLAGCNPVPEPFVFGSDQDAFCRMTISEPEFAAQLVTRTGRAYKFDSIECMRGFLAVGSVPSEDIHGLWVTDAASRTLIPVDEATFVRSTGVRSPMGGGLIAFLDASEAESLAAESGGRVIAWAGLSDDVVPAASQAQSGHGK
jgi:copper chaperone NosL